MSGAALRGRDGQMTVELAVMVPVVLVVALVVMNLMDYVEACAAFDQASLDAVVAHGVAPSGEQSLTAAVAEVESALTEAVGREGRCSVEVRAESVMEGESEDEPGGGSDPDAESESDSSFIVSPLLTRFVCTLTYSPWPKTLRLPGITLEAPLALTHERELVVDRYRPGVVV